MQCTSPLWLEFYQMHVPCGHCVSCRIAHSREWAVRLIHEMGYYDSAVFCTLTYNDENLPSDLSLDKSELQKFFKRLRKGLDQKIKYYASGEYGERNDRPHYHCIILGLSPLDKSLIERAWPYGFVHCGSVTYDSARYVADYVFKRYDGEMRRRVYGDRQEPFQLQSLGVGKRYAEDNAEQIVSRLDITVFGDHVGIPRYYKRVLGLDASVLGDQAAEHNKDLNESYLAKVKDPNLIPPALGRARAQANANRLAEMALSNDRKKHVDR